MHVHLTISEFRALVPGDKILIHVNNEYEMAIVEGYAFYNSDAIEPGWEIETDAGFIALDSAYRHVEIGNSEKMKLISFEAFRQLKAGSVINVLVNDNFIQAITRSNAYESISLANIFGASNDWEIDTDIGFVHNDSVYVEE